MTKKTTKKTSRINAAVNSVTFSKHEYVDIEEKVERWKVYVHDTNEIYFAYDKAQALAYVGKKGASHFTISLVTVPCSIF